MWKKLFTSPKPSSKEKKTTYIKGELVEFIHIKKSKKITPKVGDLKETTVELLDLFEVIKEARTSVDPNCLGSFILSMTRSKDDLLGVMVLARYAGPYKIKTVMTLIRNSTASIATPI